MATIYKMSDGALMTINMENYSEDEFIIGAVDFLGTNENTHKIDISEEVFKGYENEARYCHSSFPRCKAFTA